MRFRLLGPLYDLSARGELFRLFCFAFIKANLEFTIKVVPEEESKIETEENVDALRPYITDIDPDCDLIVSFLSLDKSYTSLSEDFNKKKVLVFYSQTRGPLTEDYKNIINLYDEIWCLDFYAYNNLSFHRSVKHIPIPINIEDTNVKINLKLDSPTKPVTNATFIFYSIGRFIERNNFRALLEAYCSAFTFDDDVCLVFKSHIDYNTKEEISYIQSFIDFCLKEGGHKNSPNLLVLVDSFPRKVILGLHKAGHCYVDCKRSDYLGLNKHYAALFGNYIIQPKDLQDSSLQSSKVYNYSCAYRPVFSEKKLYFYPNKMWLDAGVEDLSIKMKEVFETFKTSPNFNDPYLSAFNTQNALITFLKNL